MRRLTYGQSSGLLLSLLLTGCCWCYGPGSEPSLWHFRRAEMSPGPLLTSLPHPLYFSSCLSLSLLPGVGLDDPYGSLPTCDILWSHDSLNIMASDYTWASNPSRKRYIVIQEWRLKEHRATHKHGYGLPAHCLHRSGQKCYVFAELGSLDILGTLRCSHKGTLTPSDCLAEVLCRLKPWFCWRPDNTYSRYSLIKSCYFC